jgi:hypothetical protein
MELPSTARVRLVTLASWMKARSASTVKMIACATVIQNPVFAPVTPDDRPLILYASSLPFG